ncbi:Zinc carboxypeptidase [Rubripirellula obstinata]|uniref:Zinc carboxypeptidase n=1 Tax=Rubripirellula obstinata TaxID=406547 RepID=A0A5B1CHY9_9BACT|nr:M14 family metallopeptidase [Rubripirellula obstinata]KAA1259190.1 Zinc carboxypeptidase [Rubripirellula obstinata]
MIRLLTSSTLSLLFVASSSVALADPNATIDSAVSFESQDKAIRFTTDFPGGKIDRLIETRRDDFEIIIKPEIEPINDSAWYAFRVESSKTQEILVRLRYEGGSHRYEPKISRDRINWEPAENLIVSRHPGGREITLRLPVSDQALWVAGQELVGNKDIARWVESLAEKSFVTQSVIGKSVRERPIYELKIGNPNAGDSIFILSRQHPPEVTGTIGMMLFVEALCADTPLAKDFREKFQTVCVPIANPDGVARGYWRANANGVDLNRDWLQFTQPETQTIRDSMLRLQRTGNGRPWLFLDFHSTYNEMFYTAPKKNDLFPDGFTKDWLAAIDKRMPNFDVLRDDGHNVHRATSKAWVARELGIHAITYEFGDETDRPRIAEIANRSAEEMMKLLLEIKSQQK